MAYPTTLDYQIVSPPLYIGAQPITEVSATIKVPLGTIVTARDVNYGFGEFIYLEGVIGTVAGSAVVYDVKASTTTLTVADSSGLVAIAMSANVADKYGWYQITGEAIVSVAAAVAAAGPLSGLAATPGMLTPGVDGISPIFKATAKTATDTPSTGFAQIQIGRPWQSGFTVNVA